YGIAVRSLFQVPAEIEAPLTSRKQGRLFDVTLSDIRNIEIAGFAIERESPGIAETQRPDFPTSAICADKRIVVRYAICERIATCVDIDSQDLAQERAEVLTVPLRVSTAAPIAQPDVEIAIRPEEEQTDIVVRVGLLNSEDCLG